VESNLSFELQQLFNETTTATHPDYNHNTTANMEVLLGITGKDFTLIAASKAAMRGATVLKAADDKTRSLNKHTLMAFSGEAGDTSKQNYNDSHYAVLADLSPC
jgi:20S proteasome subunit beta 4